MKLHVLGIIFALVLPSTAFAQSSDCFRALMQDTSTLDLRDSSSVAQYLMDRSSRSGSRSSNLGINVPGYGKMSVGQANETAAEYARLSRMSSSSQRIESVATQTLSEASVNAYSLCLNASTPVQMTASDARADAVTLTLRFMAPVAPQPLDLDVRGGILQRPAPASLSSGQGWSVIVRREPGRDFRVVANLGPYPGELFVAHIPPAPAVPVPLPQWKSAQVTMVDPSQGKGTPGAATLPRGFTVTNINYSHIGPTANDHRFVFDLNGPEGFVRRQVVYQGNNSTPWQNRVQVVQVGDRDLYFAFSQWNDYRSNFHFKWS